jgi:type III pantothenate kinase
MCGDHAGVGREPAETFSAVRQDPHPPVGQVLVVDAGSSMTKLALVTGGDLTPLGAFPTGDDGPPGWLARFETLVAAPAAASRAINYVAMSSVTRHPLEQLRSWSRRGGVPIQVVSAESVDLPVDYRPRSALGLDRLANAVAVIERWGAPAIAVDVGTAVTCDVIAEGPRFAGGAIAPGPVAAYEGLVGRVPHLAQAGGLSLLGDLQVVPTSTAEAVRAGVLGGIAALVDGLVRRYQRLVGPCPVVVTGGLGPIVGHRSETITAIDPFLTLRGIHLATRPACDRDPSASAPTRERDARHGRAPQTVARGNGGA